MNIATIPTIQITVAIDTIICIGLTPASGCGAKVSVMIGFTASLTIVNPVLIAGD